MRLKLKTNEFSYCCFQVKVFQLEVQFCYVQALWEGKCMRKTLKQCNLNNTEITIKFIQANLRLTQLNFKINLGIGFQEH